MNDKPKSKRLDPIAFSYLRFSNIKQEEGDSKTRQTRQAEEWSEKNEVKIVKRMGDLGLSAWSGKHVKKGQLGAFLEMCKTDDFRMICQVRDVYLLVESLDRLSREKIMTAVNQLSAIIEAGVIIVTLADRQVFTPEALNNPASLIIAVTVMARANEESEMKSQRLLSAWQKKRKDAQEGFLFSRRIPSWLEVVEGSKLAKFKQRPELVKIIRRIFKLASEGVTPFQIAGVLNKEKVPTFKSHVSKVGFKAFAWHTKTVQCLLKSSGVIGTLTFVDHPDQGEDAIKEVLDYYPAIIDPKLQARALRVLQAHSSDRGKKSATFVNPFRKIAFDWNNGDPIYMRNTSCTIRRGSKVYQYETPSYSYISRDVRAGMRKGTSWRGPEFDALFFGTIRLALQVEGSTMRDEAELALNENELEKIQKQINKLRDLFIASEDGALDLGIFRSKLIELQAEEKELLTKVEDVKMKIQAGVGKVLIDQTKIERKKLHEILRSNVERIEVDCEKKRFRVKLMNGIGYEVRVDYDRGEVDILSDDFQVDAFDLRKIEVIKTKSARVA